jgi:hypothetical protein
LRSLPSFDIPKYDFENNQENKINFFEELKNLNK